MPDYITLQKESNTPADAARRYISTRCARVFYASFVRVLQTRVYARWRKKRQFLIFGIDRVSRSYLLMKSLGVITLCVAIKNAKLLQVENVENTPITCSDLLRNCWAIEVNLIQFVGDLSDSCLYGRRRGLEERVKKQGESGWNVRAHARYK